MKFSRFFQLFQSSHAISVDIQQGRVPSRENLAGAGLPDTVAERFKR